MNFFIRTLVTIIGIPLLAYVFFGPKVLFYIFLALLSISSMVEVVMIVEKNWKNFTTFAYSFLVIAMYTTLYNTGFRFAHLFLIILVYLVFFQMLNSSTKQTYLTKSFYLGAMCYIIIFPLFLLRIKDFNLGSHLILFLFITIWSVDILAYVGGSSIRGPRLAPTISPKKTIAGFVSGIIGSLIVWGVYCYFPFGKETLLKSFTSGRLLLMSVFIALISQTGDLFESRLKRIFEVKDSSNIIPGHGGILDRFDSVLFTAPLYYIIIFYFSGGF